MNQSQAQSRFKGQMAKLKGLFIGQSGVFDQEQQPTHKTLTPLLQSRGEIKHSINLDDEDNGHQTRQDKLGIERKSFNAEYTMGQKLGEGTNGVVRLCWQKGNPECKYAVKIIQTPDEEMMRIIRMTFLNTTLIKSPYIAKCYKLFIEQCTVYMVMEYVPFGNLQDLLKKRKVLSERETQIIAYCLLRGIRMLHSAGISHRDIKPDNIQVNPQDFTIKLVDFGVSRRFVSIDSVTQKYTRQRMLTVTGALSYRAPEIYGSAEYGYDSQVDIWAIGVVIYQCLTGKLPIQSDYSNEIISILSDRMPYTEYQKDPAFLRLSSASRDFLKRLLIWNPLVRLNASEGLKHVWIPDQITPCRVIKRVSKDDIDISKISNNSDILNKALVNSAMMLTMELFNTLNHSKMLETETILERDDETPTSKMSLSIQLKGLDNFKQKVQQFKLENSTQIHTKLSISRPIIELINVIDINSALLPKQENSIEIEQGDFFEMNFCESQSSLTQIDDLPPQDNEKGLQKLDAEMVKKMRQLDL